jgi:hypothetical protein
MATVYKIEINATSMINYPEQDVKDIIDKFLKENTPLINVEVNVDRIA